MKGFSDTKYEIQNIHIVQKSHFLFPCFYRRKMCTQKCPKEVNHYHNSFPNWNTEFFLVIMKPIFFTISTLAKILLIHNRYIPRLLLYYIINWSSLWLYNSNTWSKTCEWKMKFEPIVQLRSTSFSVKKSVYKQREKLGLPLTLMARYWSLVFLHSLHVRVLTSIVCSYCQSPNPLAELRERESKRTPCTNPRLQEIKWLTNGAMQISTLLRMSSNFHWNLINHFLKYQW